MKIFILIIILAMYGGVRLVIDLIRVFRYLIKEEIKAWEKRGGDRLFVKKHEKKFRCDLRYSDDVNFIKNERVYHYSGDPCNTCKIGTEEQRCKVCELPDQEG
jgi:hypothetical protein